MNINKFMPLLSIILLIVGFVWLSDTESIIAGILLTAGFIGCAFYASQYMKNHKR